MKTVNSWFSESIERYKQLTSETAELKENILALPLEEIMQRCEFIKQLQESFVDSDDKLREIMAFIGSDILENPLVGEYQRTLDLAIEETDLLAAKARQRKNLLLQELAKIHPLKKDDPKYRAGIQGYNTMVQQGNGVRS